MKSTKSLFRCLDGACVLPALIVGLSLIPARPVIAQTFMTLHSFTNGSDGAFPTAALIVSGNTFYGTTSGGGASGNGTVFKLNTDGSGFTILHSFTNGTDGSGPTGTLILSGRTLYGTTSGYNVSSNGTLFKVNTDGTCFAPLYIFTGTSGTIHGYGTNSDGAHPWAGLILSGNTLYGTTSVGGSTGYGTLFGISTDGTSFTNLHTFTGNDGTYSETDLILSGNILYGSPGGGGASGSGTIFSVNTNGTSFTNLYNFTAYSGSFPNITNGDGAGLDGGLVLSGNTFYGTEKVAGSSGYGTIFRINTDGTHFTNLHNFTAPFNLYGQGTNSDGAYPSGGVILSGNTLYGTAYEGGSSGWGAVFAINTDGTHFKNLHSFTEIEGIYPSTNSDGGMPEASLIISGNTLYGTTTQAGSSGYGTVFSLSLPGPPQLAITLSGTNVILTWPTNAAGFTLESTSNLSPATWSTNLPASVVINGQNTVTNPVSGTQQFYQLSQ